MYFIIVFFLLWLGSCAVKKDGALERIDFGKFSLVLPNNYIEKNLGSIDSYAADIILDWGTLRFDYGLYSPKMVLSEEEYIKKKTWEREDEFTLVTAIIPYPLFKDLEGKGSDYIATYDISECLKTSNCITHTSIQFPKNI
ncbi:MAG: hypothetical protein AAFU64_02695, partial [Bacteroidota bacterium]